MVAQRARTLDAMVGLVCERGFDGVSVSELCRRARISRPTFYELFGGLPECFLAVLDDGSERARGLIVEAFEREERWQDGLRSALAALLVFFDTEPCLARVLLVEASAAGEWARAHRERGVAGLTGMIVQRWDRDGYAQAHPLAAAGVMASLLGVLQTHLVTSGEQPMITLLGPLVGLVTAPYMDARAVAGEVARAQELGREIRERRLVSQEEDIGETVLVPEALRDPRAYRARECLRYLAVHSGASNSQVGAGIGVARHAQMSRLLARLDAMGLLHKQSGTPGHPNAWSLTEAGVRVARVLKDEWHSA